MKLEYHILWFEDQPKNVEPMVQTIQEGVEDLGFTPRIDLRKVESAGQDPLTNLPHHRDLDLVLMDWNLGDQDGAVLSRRVRAVFQYTDIVFYSAASTSELRRRIFDQGIDGVHCCARENLSDSTLHIIETQMHKILDVNHMRGIVIATVSDLEHQIMNCLKLLQPLAYPSNSADFAKAISVKIVKDLSKKITKVESLGTEGNYQALITDFSFNAGLRLQFLQKELQRLARVDHVPHLETLGRFLKEVVHPRNDLAHRPAVVRDGELHLEGRESPYTQRTMTDLRILLLKHVENLHNLLGLLQISTSD